MSQLVQSPQPYSPTSSIQPASRSPLYLPLDLIRYVLRKLLLVVVTVIAQAWRHPVISLALAVALVVGYQQLYQDSGSAETAEPGVTDLRVGYIEPAAVVLAFLEAQRAGDADAVWATYSEAWKGVLLERGDSPEATRQNYADARSAGAEVGESFYVGATRQTNGETAYVFSTPQSIPGAGVQDVIQIFHVGSDGLITQRQAIFPSELQQNLQQ
jgi:hypothetical protein